jgi:hypothetical protein
VREGFAEAALTMTRPELAKHFKIRRETVTAWAETLGIVLKQWVQPPAQPRVRKKVVSRRASKNGWGFPKPAVEVVRGDLVSRAMRHIMPFYAPVCRVETIIGKAGRGLYRVGSRTVEETELLALAERRGFQADAWREVRA